MQPICHPNTKPIFNQNTNGAINFIDPSLNQIICINPVIQKVTNVFKLCEADIILNKLINLNLEQVLVTSISRKYQINLELARSLSRKFLLQICHISNNILPNN